MTAINILASLIFAVGAFALVIGWFYEKPVDLRAMEALYGKGAPELTFMQKLQRELDAARIEIKAREFLLISLGLAVLGGLGFFLLAGVPLAALLGGLLGGMSYYLYLSRRSARQLQDYEDQLPVVVARLITGAKKGSTFRAAAQHVARYGPELCREDWAYVTEQMGFGAPLDQIFRSLSARRGSVLLDTIFELLVIQEQRQLPLTEMLPGIQRTLADRVTMLKKARVRLSGPIRELTIVATIPFLIVIILRLIAPAIAEGFKSLWGQLAVAAGWTMTLGAYILAYRSFTNGLREETSFTGHGLEAQARGELARSPSAGQGANPLGQMYRS